MTEQKMSTFVVGFIPTAEGEAAVSAAIEEARVHGARLVVVRSSAAESASKGPSLDLQLAWTGVTTRLEEAAVTYDVREFAEGSDGASDVLTVADELNADLIVIGLRRRSPVGKLIMGSTAQQILLDATCPVLAVKAG